MVFKTPGPERKIPRVSPTIELVSQPDARNDVVPFKFREEALLNKGFSLGKTPREFPNGNSG